MEVRQFPILTITEKLIDEYKHVAMMIKIIQKSIVDLFIMTERHNMISSTHFVPSKKESA